MILEPPELFSGLPTITLAENISLNFSRCHHGDEHQLHLCELKPNENGESYTHLRAELQAKLYSLDRFCNLKQIKKHSSLYKQVHLCKDPACEAWAIFYRVKENKYGLLNEYRTVDDDFSCLLIGCLFHRHAMPNPMEGGKIKQILPFKNKQDAYEYYYACLEPESTAKPGRARGTEWRVCKTTRSRDPVITNQLKEKCNMDFVIESIYKKTSIDEEDETEWFTINGILGIFHKLLRSLLSRLKWI